MSETMELDQDAYYSDWWLLRRAHLSIFFTLTTTLPTTRQCTVMKESWQNTKYGKAKEQWTTSVSSRRIDMHQKHERGWRRSAGNVTL
jgi:hypothetical protein